MLVVIMIGRAIEGYKINNMKWIELPGRRNEKEIACDT
jgi:hypothetical protein